MIEDDINSHRCRFCKSSFSDEILKKIKDDRNDVYCENCGDLIKRVQNKYNFNPIDIIENASNTSTNDTPTKPQKELENNPDALHYPIGRIFYDKEFPLIFKSNFIIVFSRLIYFHALHLESKGQIELGGLEVPENAINDLYMSIRHVQNMRIKSEFLNNLHEISKEEFERYLKQLQAKIQSNRQYREDFIVYSRWLIKRVLMIVSEKKEINKLSKFERTIIKDLKRFELLNLFEFETQSEEFKDTDVDKVIKKDRPKFFMNVQNEEMLDRYKVPNQEKTLIREEFSAGIPIQRIKEIIKTYNENLEDSFIETLQTYYNEMITKNKQRLSLGVRRIDKIINGFDNMIYLDRSISQDSLKKMELLINRKIKVIRNWKKPRRERISGTRIKILSDGINTIKKEIKSGIHISHLTDIVKNYKYDDDFFHYIKKIYLNAIESNIIKIKIPLTKLNEFITNWENILYRGYVISEKDFSKLQILIGNQNSISHKVVYGRKNLEAVKLVKNKSHAELIGTFIVRGSITTRGNDLIISYNTDDHHNYIKHLKDLINTVFGKPPNMLRTRDRLHISGQNVIKYLTSQGLSNENRRVPSWINKPLTWIRENTDEWKKNYMPLVVACLRGMINGAGWIGVKSKHDRIVIQLSNINRSILEDFKELCNSLDIRTSDIKESIRKDGRQNYYIYISSVDQVKRFLIDVIKPKRWECLKDEIQQILDVRGTSIEVVLEMSPELKNLRRKLFQHQKQRYTFLYNPIRIKDIENPILRDCLYNYIENVSLKLFPYNEFEVKNNIRPSSLKFVGEHLKDENGRTIYREVIKTQFIKNHFISKLTSGPNPKMKIYNYNELSDGLYKKLLDLVREVYDEFRNKRLGRPWHEPILKNIMIKLPNAMVCENPVWKRIESNLYCIGHIDLNLVNNNTLFIADLKDDETDVIKSLLQILSYGLMQKRLIFKKPSDFNAFNLKCILFTKDEVWEFDPEILKSEFIDFIKYVNSLREKNLKSLPFSKGLKRTDLLEDIEKVVGFPQRYVEEEEDYDLDVDNS